MLQKASNVFVLTDDKQLKIDLESLAAKHDIGIVVVDSWNSRYDIMADVIISDLSKTGYIGAKFLDKVTIALTDMDSFDVDTAEYNNYIFNRRNLDELSFALLKPEIKYLACNSADMADILTTAQISKFIFDGYDFNFQKSEYYYKGEKLYVTKSWELYLAKWLLLGTKENNKRSYLSHMRDKYQVPDFLSGVTKECNLCLKGEM